jgi:sulfate/thiosulfate transport system substrate-binding protein
MLANKKRQFVRLVVLILIFAAVIPAATAQDAPETVTITLAGYAVPREAYGDLIPAFQAYWLAESGQNVIVQESYQASGAQSRAIVGGFEADIAALSIESDITRIVDAGLITHDWKADGYEGFVTNSVVVLATRPGNPEGIEDWIDLAGDVEIITPDPATSGGAQWNILGALGAVRREHVEGFTAENEDEFLSALIENVGVFDRDGRESFLTFESGIGDVAITYENEVAAGLAAGGEYDVVYPTSTILIQNPIAVIDENVDKHGTREVAEAFVAWLRSEEAQRIFVENGFRSVNEAVAADPAVAELFPEVEDLFTVEEFGGWGTVRSEIFGDEGHITALIAEVKGE